MRGVLAFLVFVLAPISVFAAPRPRLVVPTCTLSASPSIVSPGGSSTLTWTTTQTRATNPVILDGQVQSPNGTISVSLTAPTDYTLVAVGQLRTTVCRVSVGIAGFAALAATEAKDIANIVGVLPVYAARHEFWVGSDYTTTVSPQANPPGLTPSPVGQWVLDNVINVSPTSKRPALFASNQNVYRQIPTSIRGGVKCLTGMGGTWALYNTDALAGDPAAELAANPEYSTLVTIIDLAIEQGCDYRLYVDEPGQGYGCPSDQIHTEYCVARHVRLFNLMFDYAKSRIPTMKTGICLFDSGLYLLWLRAGLHADFACIESYINSAPVTDVFGPIHAEFPNVEKYHLLSDTLPLCAAYNYTTTGEAPWPVTNAYWNFNQYGLWYAGIGLDLDWLKNGQEYQSTGQREFCRNPRGLMIEWAMDLVSGGEAIVNTFNNSDLTTEVPEPALTKCEWRVVSFPDGNGPNHFLPEIALTGVETLPWTEIPCSGTNPALPAVTPAYPAFGSVVKLTAGPSALCRHNGTYSCMVYYRVTNSLGRQGLRAFPSSVTGIP